MNETFIKNISTMHGEVGKKWLEDLPSVIAMYEKKWGIQVLAPFTLSYNYVAPAVKPDGTQCVIKIGFPGDIVFLNEIKALGLFNGEGMVKLLEVNEEQSVMLLERLNPGASLQADGNDEEVISIAAGVMKKIVHPIKDIDTFQTITEWAKSFVWLREKFEGRTGPFEENHISRAENIFKHYSLQSDQLFLLHGDLHKDNILSSERGWLAIDPKGVIGPKEFELASFLRNPMYDLPKETNKIERSKHRIELMAEQLELDRKVLLDWTFAQAVLSAVWTLEDHGEVSDSRKKNIEVLEGIRF